MASNEGSDQGFPIKLIPQDLQDPTLGRLNRAFQYLWTQVQKFKGNGVVGNFLSGTGAYTTPVVDAFPAKHDSTGSPGAAAYDSLGNIYVCYAQDKWVRVGPSGTSTTF